MTMKPIEVRPSNAPLWVPCNGAPRLISQCDTPEGETAAQAEGIVAHWVAEQVAIDCRGVPGTLPDGLPVPDDMLHGAYLFADELDKIGGQVHIEKEITVPMISPNFKGRMDATIVCSNRDLYIVDYKFGWGIVEPEGNWQLICYALGAISKFYPDKYPDKISLVIIQPRPYHPRGPVRSWELSAVELLKHGDTVKAAYEAATGDNPELTPGPHCMNCPARVSCTANQRAAYKLYDSIVQLSPVDLEPGVLGSEIKFLRQAKQLVDSRLDGLEPQALEYIKAGIGVPGWRAAPGRGSREWQGEESDVIALGEMMGVSMTDQVIKSPAKAEAAGLPKDVVNAYTRKIPGALKLAPDNGETAESIFKR